MILVPKMLHEDHFDTPATEPVQFWARGHGVSVIVAAYALTKLDVDTAAELALYWVAGIAVAYPFNAKFKLFNGDLKPKYPMHYVPEILMTSLLALGLTAE